MGLIESARPIARSQATNLLTCPLDRRRRRLEPNYGCAQVPHWAERFRLLVAEQNVQAQIECARNAIQCHQVTTSLSSSLIRGAHISLYQSLARNSSVASACLPASLPASSLSVCLAIESDQNGWRSPALNCCCWRLHRAASGSDLCEPSSYAG